jgi:NADPH2:quinone reductase
MRAVEISEYGGPEVLRVVDVPIPEPGVGEILVRVSAAGVNFTDIGFRTGQFTRPLPLRLGKEAAGTVAAIGPGVTGFALGQRVAATLLDGAYAEYVAAPADRWVPLPDTLDDARACAALMQGMTGHYLTHDAYPIRSGDIVLFQAAASGVAAFALPMAKERGATVIGVVSRPEKADAARRAGADHVIISPEEDFVAAARRLTGGAGVHAVYDSVGRETFARDIACVRTRGTVVLFGAASGAVETFDTSEWLFYSKYVVAPSIEDYVATRDELHHRAAATFAGVLEGRYPVTIGGAFPLAAVADAHRALADRGRTGKLILIP